MKLFDTSKIDKTPVRKDRASEISHKNNVDNRIYRLDKSIALYCGNREEAASNLKFK